MIEKEPAPNEDPPQRRGIAAVQKPLDGSLWQKVDRGLKIGILNESGVLPHPLCQLAFPRFLDRQLESIVERENTLLALGTIGIAAGLRETESKADPERPRGMRRSTVPAEVELRFPATTVVKRENVAGEGNLEAVRVEEARSALSLALTALDDSGGDGGRVDRVEQRGESRLERTRRLDWRERFEHRELADGESGRPARRRARCQRS